LEISLWSLGGSLRCGQRSVGSQQGGLEFLLIGDDDWTLAWLVETLGDIQAETLVEVVQQGEADWHGDLPVDHVVVEGNRAALTVG
jgi:hypothetical protein